MIRTARRRPGRAVRDAADRARPVLQVPLYVEALAEQRGHDQLIASDHSVASGSWRSGTRRQEDAVAARGDVGVRVKAETVPDRKPKNLTWMWGRRQLLPGPPTKFRNVDPGSGGSRRPAERPCTGAGGSRRRADSGSTRSQEAEESRLRGRPRGIGVHVLESGVHEQCRLHFRVVVAGSVAGAVEIAECVHFNDTLDGRHLSASIVAAEESESEPR